MCAFKFHTILVRVKYKMAAIHFFKEYVILCILHVKIDFFYLTLLRNNGHQSKLELY